LPPSSLDNNDIAQVHLYTKHDPSRSLASRLPYNRRRPFQDICSVIVTFAVIQNRTTINRIMLFYEINNDLSDYVTMLLKTSKIKCLNVAN
jgi:hypothetical protein